MLQGLVLANSHVFSEFEDSDKSPKGLFFIDAAMDSGTSRDDWRNLSVVSFQNQTPKWFSFELSFGSSLAMVGRLGMENNCYLLHYHVVSYYIIISLYNVRVKCSRVM